MSTNQNTSQTVLADNIFSYFNVDDSVINKITEEYTGVFDGVDDSTEVTIVTGSASDYTKTNYFKNYYLGTKDDDNLVFSVMYCSSGYTTTPNEPYINYRRFVSSLINYPVQDTKFTNDTNAWTISSVANTIIHKFIAVSFARQYIKEGIRPILNTKFMASSSVDYVMTSKIENTTYNMINGDAYILSSNNSEADGIVFPDLGLILINVTSLSGSITSPDTAYAWFEAGDNVSTNDSMQLFVQAKEKINSNTYFCRLKNKQYNFSNNPTWTSGSNHIIAKGDMWGNPTTYVTSIGLYDEDNNLIAVGKLNKPIKKDFDRELLVKVKLKF